MPQPVEFNKHYAAYLLDCLANGKAIEPPTSKGWRRFDEMMLAGAACFAVMSHGPIFYQADLTPEQMEDNDNASVNELLATITFLGGVMMAVKDDQYDERWDPVMTCAVYGAPFDIKVQPIEGWRQS